MSDLILADAGAEKPVASIEGALALIAPGGPLVPTEIFKPGGVDALIEKIEREVLAVKTDISTEKGRKAIRSLAYQVARSKTALDDMGKELGAEWARKKEAVDADRRLARGRLDALADKVRAPLARWEAREAARIAGHEQALAAIAGSPLDARVDSSADFAQRLAELRAWPARDWQEFEGRAADVLAREIQQTEAKLAWAKQREAAEAERARIEAEEALQARIEAERIQAERDARIAAEAAERAKQEAEARAAEQQRKAAEEAEAQARRIEEEAAARLRAIEAEAAKERERMEAEARAAAAREAAAVAAAREAERKHAEAMEAERQRSARAERFAEEAVLLEMRIAAEKAEAEEARRAADLENQGKVNREILKAFVGLGFADDVARKIILAIVRGNIPHVSVRY